MVVAFKKEVRVRKKNSYCRRESGYRHVVHVYHDAIVPASIEYFRKIPKYIRLYLKASWNILSLAPAKLLKNKCRNSYRRYNGPDILLYDEGTCRWCNIALISEYLRSTGFISRCLRSTGTSLKINSTMVAFCREACGLVHIFEKICAV